MISKQKIGNNFNGSGHGLIEVESCKCPEGTEENHKKPQSG
jgi:hypothetical protein